MVDDECMTMDSSTERRAHGDAVRHEIDGLADKLAQLQRSGAIAAAASERCEADLRDAEALAARADFAEPEAWSHAAEQLDDAVARLRLALSAQDADRRVAAAGPDLVDVRRAISEQVAAWQSFVEELIVQGHLAGMEMRDTLDALAGGRRQVREQLRQFGSHPVAETADAIDALRNLALSTWRRAAAR